VCVCVFSGTKQLNSTSPGMSYKTSKELTVRTPEIDCDQMVMGLQAEVSVVLIFLMYKNLMAP
jgi:hypothetical protein